MAQYIDKNKIIKEIEKIESNLFPNFYEYNYDAANVELLDKIKSFINTLEVKEVNTWHLQEKENIYDAVKDWGLYTFVCIMKDGTIQKFSGCLDEDCEGHINAHIDGVNDGYDNVDDIVKWIEII